HDPRGVSRERVPEPLPPSWSGPRPPLASIGGIPTALITAMTPVALRVGAPRIIRVGRIPHPLGDPSRAPGRERQLRRAIVETAPEALCTAVNRPTVFEVAGAPGD